MRRELCEGPSPGRPAILVCVEPVSPDKTPLLSLTLTPPKNFFGKRWTNTCKHIFYWDCLLQAHQSTNLFFLSGNELDVLYRKPRKYKQLKNKHPHKEKTVQQTKVNNKTPPTVHLPRDNC